MVKHVTLKPEDIEYILAVCDAAGIYYSDPTGAILNLAHRVADTLPPTD